MKPPVSSFSLLALTVGLSLSLSLQKSPAQTPDSGNTGVQPFRESDRKPSKSDAFTRGDRRFIVDVLRINHNESVIGQLIAERAATREVRAMARQLVADLGEASREARELAKQKGIPLPDSRSEAGDLKAWNEKAPENLDGDYIESAREALEDLVALYEKASAKSDDPDITAFAQKLLPAAREQLKRVEGTAPVQL